MNVEELKIKQERVTFGFWIYLMTDLLMFAVLFAAYAVLRNNTFGGPSIKEIFDPPYILIETFILLTSSFTSGLGVLYATARDKNKTLIYFGATFLLGFIFLAMEIYEFSHLLSEGHSWQTSGFLSSYFGLVGTHGVHITAGLIWLGILLTHVYLKGINNSNLGKLKLLSIFWHFLDIVWIFIFTIVYLLGGIL